MALTPISLNIKIKGYCSSFTKLGKGHRVKAAWVKQLEQRNHSQASWL